MSVSDPYLLLGLDEDVTDAEVTAAYHNALRRFPPEQAPDTFARISEAYESIRTEEDRIRRRFFSPPIRCAELPAYFATLDAAIRLPRIPRDRWLREARKQWLESRLA